jgi:hypothetical protein
MAGMGCLAQNPIVMSCLYEAKLRPDMAIKQLLPCSAAVPESAQSSHCRRKPVHDEPTSGPVAVGEGLPALLNPVVQIVLQRVNAGRRHVRVGRQIGTSVKGPTRIASLPPAV